MNNNRKLEIVELAYIVDKYSIEAGIDRDLGVEVHDVAIAGNGARVFIRYCGSWAGGRPGLRRSDTVKKLLHNAYCMKAEGITVPYIVITNQLPRRGSASDMLIKTAIKHKVLHGIYNLNRQPDESALRDWAKGVSE